MSTLEPARVNELIAQFGREHYDAMHAMKRTTQKSMLFDLPRRSPLGWHCLYEHQAGFLREVCGYASPEELGRRMRTAGSRPYQLQPFIIICSHLAARQERMLELGLHAGDPFPEERPEDLAFVVDFWARMQGAYRADGALLPGERGGALPILDDGEIADLVSRCTAAPEDRYTLIRRMSATLELYEFILHGEQRDGIFGHGPYDLGDGRVLFCKEFNDLRNEYMPWAATRARLPVANVIIPHVVRDVEIICDLFGSMTVEPHELAGRLDGIAVLTREGGELRALDDAACMEIQHLAADAQEELFLTAVEWDERYKITYGAPLFANHLKPIFDLAGMPDEVGERAMRACDETAERRVDAMLATEMPPIWAQMANPEGGNIYWPMAER